MLNEKRDVSDVSFTTLLFLSPTVEWDIRMGLYWRSTSRWSWFQRATLFGWRAQKVLMGTGALPSFLKLPGAIKWVSNVPEMILLVEEVMLKHTIKVM